MIDRRTLISGAAGVSLLAATASAQSAAPRSGAPASGAVPPAAPASGADPWRQRGTVPRGGGVIGWAIAGNGPKTIVAMPKLGGWINDWAPLARELGPQYTLLAVDPPGHGSSKMATEPPKVQMLSESAAMVKAALDELGVRDFALMGNSLGGCIAATMAGLWPKLATHLVLISTAIYNADPIEQIIAEQDAVKPPIYDADGNPLPRDAATANQRFAMTDRFLDEMNASRRAAGRWIRVSERGVRREGIADMLTRVEVPTLLLYSDAGSYVRFPAMGMKLLRNGRSVILPGGGSFMHQEKPVETASTIRDFLRA